MTVDDFRCLLGAKGAWALSLSAFVLGAYLPWTHTEHFVSALPYLIFLLCPLMHLRSSPRARPSSGGSSCLNTICDQCSLA